jgi:hypothetical protein
MKSTIVAILCALTAQALVGQSAQRVPLGIVSDWTHRHVLFPDSKDNSVMARIQRDPRWLQNWYLRYREAWWPEHHRGHRERDRRDWSVPLAASSATAFEPLFDFAFTLGPDTGYGTLNTTDVGRDWWPRCWIVPAISRWATRSIKPKRVLCVRQ